MGFKQRERKRKTKAAQASAQRKARHTGSSARRWYLTIVTRDCCCARCARVLRAGDEMVYRHEPRESRCVPCGDQHDDSKGYRPSLKWEQARGGDRKRANPGGQRGGWADPPGNRGYRHAACE